MPIRHLRPCFPLTSSLQASLPGQLRLQQIGSARQVVLHEGQALPSPWVDPWIERSWQRCLSRGMAPGEPVAFDAISSSATRRAQEASRELVAAARPVLQGLTRAMQDTRYFALLTTENGVVVDAMGPIDRSDRRVDLITRIGVDLSEKAVGTTAIGAALTERTPVWLHRGEHFFDDTSVYSCAGSPLFGHDGRCVGMLDLTGVMAAERPELRHLVTHAARHVENALALNQPHALLLRMSWPGWPSLDESQGLLGLNEDGIVVTSNSVAREMLPQLQKAHSTPWHARDLFALPYEQLFDAGRWGGSSVEVPLWSGMRLQIQSSVPGQAAAGAGQLRDVETALIRKAVQEAKGNVAAAAKALGVGRATVYRKLAK